MRQKKIHIVVEVEGGSVIAVYANRSHKLFDVDVLDHDDASCS